MDAIEKQVGASVGGLNIDGMVKDLTKGVEDAAKGAGDGLKKLFGK